MWLVLVETCFVKCWFHFFSVQRFILEELTNLIWTSVYVWHSLFSNFLLPGRMRLTYKVLQSPAFISTCYPVRHGTVTLNECVSKSFRTGRLERELQMVQLSATRCSCIAISWVSLVSFAAITLCVTSKRVFIVVISLSTQFGNFWIHPRTVTTKVTVY
jgi:hypothetical protein